MDLRHHSTDSRSAHGAPDTDRQWTVADLIDFEYYLDADERRLREEPAARKALSDRDRTLYLDEISAEVAAHPPHTPAHRRASLRRWLAARRNAEDPAMRHLLPGAAFGTAQRLVTIVIAALGVILGVGVASALLSYDGTRPVSVSWYLFLLVIVQFALVLSVITAWVLRSTRGQVGAPTTGLLMHLMRRLVTKATGWLQSQRIGHAASEIQEKARSQQGLLKSQYALYGPVSYLPLLIPAQIFGVAFNVGIIVTTLLLEWFTDLAFGWGSTLNVHPQTIFDLTRLMALPWGWLLGEGVGYPSLEQVAGSRIILEHWATATPTIKPDPMHLRSWGPFLVLAVLTYGLLPRLLLWGGSVFAQTVILARLPFTHGRTQALYARMLAPRVETSMSGSRRGSEMPIPAESLPRNLRTGVTEGRAEAPPVTSARPWRNALVRRAESSVETPARSPGPTPDAAATEDDSATPGVSPGAPMGPAVGEPKAQDSDRTAVHVEPKSREQSKDLKTATDAERLPQQPATPADRPGPSVHEAPTLGPSSEETAVSPVAAPPQEDRAKTEDASALSKTTPPPEAKSALQVREPSKRARAPGGPEPKPKPKTPAIDERQTSVGESVPKQPAPSIAAKVPIVEPVVATPESAVTPGSSKPKTETSERRPAPAFPPDAQEDVSDQGPRRLPTESASQRSPEADVSAEQPAPRPVVEVPPATREAGSTEAPASAPPSVKQSRGTRFAPDACLLLLHVDIDDVLEEEDRPRLEQMLMLHTGWRIATTATFGAGTAMTEDAIAVLEKGDWQAPPPRIAVIEDGSQPPITESLRFLRELRAAAGTRAQIILALVGDPTDDDRLPPIRPFDYTDWQRKIDQMADPYLRLEMLAPPEADGDV
jgi:hypothetical protein